jgi:predicted SnoaL-like aldol condensation-catalyzing enzyme
MEGAAPARETVNPKTGMTHTEMREFIRNHFEEFVNRKNVDIGNVNFAPHFVDHGADVPPGMPPGPAGAIAYVASALRKFPDLHVTIEDMIAEDDKVVVRNHWTATDTQAGKQLEFRGIVIWRITDRQIVERWAYLEAPHPAA